MNTLPENFHEQEGDLLEVKDGIICHQTNTTSNTWSGLAKSIFDMYPEANTYKAPLEDNLFYNMRQVGNIDYFKVDEKLWIANINSQRHKGKANCADDTEKMRITWFKNTLAAMSWMEEEFDIYFPKLFGCNLAGGCWDIYRNILIDFARENPHFNIYIIEKK